MTQETPTRNTLLTEDAINLRRLKRVEKGLKDEYETAKEQRQRFESMLMDRMEEEGCEGVKSDGNNFVPATTTYGQVQDRATFIEWAKENDAQLIEYKERGELINQLVREHIDNGEPLPPGLGFYDRKYISIRAA